MSTSELSNLIAAFKNGDQIAFEHIYLRYWETMYLSALKRTRDENVSKEITQELFIHLWEKRATLNVESIEAYLYGAVKFRVINYFKAAITRQKYHEDMLTLLGDEAVNPTESLLSVAAIKTALEQILNKMPERMRLIFSMSRFEQKSVSEIADELNISDQTVKNQLTSALKIIREHGSLTVVLLLLTFS